jgi:two-component SAPR family response regulator
MLQNNETLFMIDSDYSLEETDFIQFIETTKKIIEITDTFNTFERLINNYSFFIPHNEIYNHNSFVANFRAIYKTTYKLFILIRRTFGNKNRNISY